ncbi:MAG: 3-phosphoshikimate 1-carboxyvinyltransferase [Anaerolineae bacterium]|jgi:3-phosphoshikimate 1-carboxyvinyltransferase|nr:3-phosphoshikimate 1-carboxyvinyltransferase [Anaerolineae bacterium]
MSHIRARGAGGPPLRGRAALPGDKSISHRAILLNMLAGGAARVTNFLPAGDCRASLRVAGALGAEVEVLSPTELRVHGRGMVLPEPDDVLDCGRSGTTMRLLAGILAGQPFAAVLSGDAQLRRRPMARVAEPLRLMGATVLGRDGGRLPPLTVQGRALRGIEYHLPVASAQVKSALLLAGLYAEGPTTLHVPGPARDHTERMLRAMGAQVATRAGDGGHTLHAGPAAALAPLDLAVPGDFSSAAFLLVAATLVPGSEVVLEGVGINPTRTGLLDVLRAMGAEIEVLDEGSAGGEPVADLAVRSAGLRGIEVGGDLVVRAIDELPILAVAATQARGETLVRDAAELRVKETDRVATTVAELRRLGAAIEARPDGFLVQGPTRLRGAPVDSHGDHRLAMALVVAGLVAEGETVVHDCGCIPDSFPGFEALLAGLGGRIAP